jgi:hypothetical protein
VQYLDIFDFLVYDKYNNIYLIISKQRGNNGFNQ